MHSFSQVRWFLAVAFAGLISSFAHADGCDYWSCPDYSGAPPDVVVELVTITGPSWFSAECGTYCTTLSNWATDPYTGATLPAGVVAATHKAEAINIIYGVCQRAGEDQYTWLTRQVQNCISNAMTRLNAALVLGCKAAGEDLIPTAANGALSPAPTQCP